MNKRTCPVCDKLLSKTQFIKHLEKEHNEQFNALISEIITENNEQYCIKDIAEKHGISEKFIKEKLTIKENQAEYNIKKPLIIKEWEPQEYKMEATTIWGFRNRGKWATHNGDYRGNWSPYIPRNIILRYSKEGDVVLDQFLGSGTTLVETKLLNRKGIGVDINPNAIEIARRNTGFKKENTTEVEIYNGDARNLEFIDDGSIDLICTHPPYSNIIKYSEDIQGDLSHLNIDDFLKEMKKVSDESFRILKEDKYCAILIGDTRKNKHMIPLGFNVMQVFLSSGFLLKEIIIKEQHNCKATGFWYTKSIENNFLLIAHEYLFVFRKP